MSDTLSRNGAFITDRARPSANRTGNCWPSRTLPFSISQSPWRYHRLRPSFSVNVPLAPLLQPCSLPFKFFRVSHLLDPLLNVPLFPSLQPCPFPFKLARLSHLLHPLFNVPLSPLLQPCPFPFKLCLIMCVHPLLNNHLSPSLQTCPPPFKRF